MDITLLSRIQFTITTIFHFLFVPLTLGLSIYVAAFETIGYVKKDDRFDKLARFFGKLFVINFAVGVVSGIVQEFEFGMNWSGYSRYVGDVFGAPLAIEALSAFFLESTFIGVWIFGKDRLSKKMQLISIWLVAIASNISSYWILVANSFMQEPVGYTIKNDRAEMSDFLALMTNPHALLQFSHVLASALVTAACFIIAISAYKLLKKKDTSFFAKSFKIGIITCILSLGAVALIGDQQGKHIAKNQPMKMAAIESLWETEQPAGFSIISIIDENNKQNNYNLEVPGMLSFLSFGDFNAEVKGINDLQKEFEAQYGAGNYIPPVTITFWSFRFMLGIAGLILLICLLSILKMRKEKYVDSKWLLKLSLLLLPLPYLANTFGWIVTEVGRQPWIVYKLLTVEQGASKVVSSGWILFTIIGFVLVYSVIGVINVALMVKNAKKEI